MPTPLAGLDWLEPEDFPTWRRRLELERRAGRLAPGRRDALRALLSFYGPDGLFPSDTVVADLAGVSPSTVYRARKDARRLKMLDWEATRKNVAGRQVQGPNKYSILIPSTPVCPSERQSDGRRKKVSSGSKKSGADKGRLDALAEFTQAAMRGPDLLAMRRSVIEARLLAGWRG